MSSRRAGKSTYVTITFCFEFETESLRRSYDERVSERSTYTPSCSNKYKMHAYGT